MPSLLRTAQAKGEQSLVRGWSKSRVLGMFGGWLVQGWLQENIRICPVVIADWKA